MVNFPGRNDRRRRFLKEEVLAAASSRVALKMDFHTESADSAPRYSEAAGVENHPQITDFVPRRYGTIAMLALGGAATSSVLAAMHYFVLPIAAARGMNAAAFDLGAPGNLTSWVGAVVWLFAGIFSAMVYSIRRHRIDDIRGRYRVWAAAALACLVLSANSVAGMHVVLADVLRSVTGWWALRDGAVWWMAVAGIPLAWIFVRALVDIRECRLGVVLLLTGLVCYAISATNFLGYGFVSDARTAPILIATPLLFGHWLMFAAIVSYARFVVLDAQGLVTLRRRATVKRSKKTASAKLAKESTAGTDSSGGSSPLAGFVRRSSPSGKQPADSGQWVDGSRQVRDRYNDDDDEDEATDGDRKLSKSDRKRLRKLKAQGRAA